MDKKNNLRNSREFRKVYDKGKSIANRYLVLFYLENNLDYNRVGISVTKKIGKAVTRNKVKRLIKEGFRVHSDKVKNGYDLIFLSRIRANQATFKEIESAINHLIKKSGLKA